MKKTTAVGLLILAGLGLATYGIINYFKQQANLLKEFTWKITSFQLNKITLQEVQGSIVIRFSSISNLEFIIEKFYLDVYINGQPAGYVNDITQSLIPANGNSDIPIAFNVAPQYLFTDATDILAYTLKQKDAIITLNGYAAVKSGFISATLPIKCNCSVQNLSCDCS